MDIKTDIEQMLAESGWSAHRLVKESGADKDSIYRLLSGRRKTVLLPTFQLIQPFIYGDKRPPKKEEA